MQAFFCLTIDDGRGAASPQKSRGWKNELVSGSGRE
jgi:hypothetical protein